MSFNDVIKSKAYEGIRQRLDYNDRDLIRLYNGNSQVILNAINKYYKSKEFDLYIELVY